MTTPKATEHDVVEWLKARRWFFATEEGGELTPSDIPHRAAELIAHLRQAAPGAPGAAPPPEGGPDPQPGD